MITTRLGNSPLGGSRLAYCYRRIADGREEKTGAAAAVIAAYEAGNSFFDGADSYDGGRCEELMGRTLREVSGMREGIVITSKCGVRPAGSLDRSSPGR